MRSQSLEIVNVLLRSDLSRMVFRLSLAGSTCGNYMRPALIIEVLADQLGWTNVLDRRLFDILVLLWRLNALELLVEHLRGLLDPNWFTFCDDNAAHLGPALIVLRF